MITIKFQSYKIKLRKFRCGFWRKVMLLRFWSSSA